MTNFFLRWKGKYCDYDLVYGPQCVDIIKQYFKDELKLQPLQGNAVDYWKDIDGFTRIENKGMQWPNPGDIVIWKATPQNPYGHIAICNWSRTFDLGVFEQNYPQGSPCHYRDTNYKGILGWLRPNKAILWDVAWVGLNPPSYSTFLDKVREYSGGKIIPRIKVLNNQIIPTTDIPNYDKDVKPFVNTLPIKGCESAFIFYDAKPNSAFEVATLYPEKNITLATVPMPCHDTVLVHAFLHLLRDYINHNKLAPYIEDVERYPTSWNDIGNFNNPGWRFLEQYQEIVKALKL